MQYEGESKENESNIEIKQTTKPKKAKQEEQKLKNK